MCLEAVFTYGTAVLDREIACIKTMVGPTSLLRSGSDRFMRPVLSEVSDYCAALVEEQYVAQLRMQDSHIVVPDPESPSRYIVEKCAGDGSHRVVDTSDWSCSCTTFVTTELPCRHIIFYSRVHAKDEFLPLDVIRTRWLVRAAVPMLPALVACRDQLQSLRTGLLLVDPASILRDQDPSEMDEEESCNDDLEFMSIDKRHHHHPSVAHVRLARGEVATGVVLDNLEKRNVVVAEFQPLMTYMMAQSLPRFKCMATYLRETLDGLLAAFKNIPLTNEDEVEEAISAAMRKCELSPKDQIRELVESTLDRSGIKVLRPAYGTENVSTRAELDYTHTIYGRSAVEQGRAIGAVEQGRGVGEVDQGRGVGDATLPAACLETGDGQGEATPMVIEGGVEVDDNHDVSSLGVSSASVILQDAVVYHASMLTVAKPASIALTEQRPLLFKPIPFQPFENNNVSAVPLPNPTTTKRSAHVAHLDESILEKVVLRVRESKAPAKLQKSKGRWKATKHLTQRSECTVDLHDLVAAARLSADLASVAAKLKAYPVLFDGDWLQKRPIVVDMRYVVSSDYTLNFTIPTGLLRRFELAIAAAKQAQPPPLFVDMNAPPTSNQLVARIEAASAVRGFTDGNVSSVRAFYDTMASCEAYALDLAWLCRRDEDMPPEVRDIVLDAMKTSALDSHFALNARNENPPTSIAFHDVIGHLAGESWLNDAVLVFLLRQIADDMDGLLVVDSIRPTTVEDRQQFRVPADRPMFQTPSYRPADHQVVVFPVNVAKSHGCLICVTIEAHNGVRVAFYDSLEKQSNARDLQTEWTNVCEPFVRGWCVRHLGEYRVDSTEIISTPRQDAKDNNNCGVYCIATALDFATKSSRFRSMPTFSPQFIQYLRLNFMRSILCSSEQAPAPREDWAAGIMEKIDPKLRATQRQDL